MRDEVAMDVGDLMTGDLIAVRPSDRAGRALNLLLESGLHALPILDEGRPVGIVTTADLVPIDRDIPLEERFLEPPFTVDCAASVADAASLMRREYVHHLIVTDGDDAVGMLSTHDLIKVLESAD